MGFFFLGQSISHCARLIGEPGLCHFLLLLFGIGLLRARGALLCALGMTWQLLLSPEPLRCESWLWFLCKPQAEEDLFFQILSSSWLGGLADSLRLWLRLRCLAWDPLYGPWLLGLLSGESQQGPWFPLYQQLGLLHVLVVSGSHFTLVSGLLRLVLFYPLTFLYMLRIVSMERWPLIRLGMDVTLATFLLAFLCLVQAQPPCQRAFFMAVLPSLNRWLSPITVNPLRQALYLQALLFPASFFSLSNALSWAATSCLSAPRGLRPRIVAEVRLQLANLAFFSGFAPLGILVNLCLLKMWDALLLLGLLTIASDWAFLRRSYRQLCEQLHGLLAVLVDLQTALWGSARLELSGGEVWRWLALCSVALIVLRRMEAGSAPKASSLVLSARPP